MCVAEARTEEWTYSQQQQTTNRKQRFWFFFYQCTKLYLCVWFSFYYEKEKHSDGEVKTSHANANNASLESNSIIEPNTIILRTTINYLLQQFEY